MSVSESAGLDYVVFILLPAVVVVLMSVLTCVTCCCHKTRMKKSDI